MEYRVSGIKQCAPTNQPLPRSANIVYVRKALQEGCWRAVTCWDLFVLCSWARRTLNFFKSTQAAKASCSVRSLAEEPIELFGLVAAIANRESKTLGWRDSSTADYDTKIDCKGRHGDTRDLRDK